MKISYLITVHNEALELNRLLHQLFRFIIDNETDDEIVILDDFSTDKQTIEYIDYHKFLYPFIKVVQHALNKDFGSHKQFGNEQCSGSHILQIDADEYLSNTLLENLHEIIESNPTVDLFWIPRVNIVRGITDEDVRKWGWKVSKVPEYPDLPIINFPDRQGRLYRNSPKIQWKKKLHEQITGAEYVCTLPDSVDFSIIHDKVIDRQRKQNEFYMKNFTTNENRGIG